MTTETAGPTRFQFLLDEINELRERVRKLEAAAPEIDYGAPFNTNGECQAHACGYYRHYLVWGPPDLAHEGYHAAERIYDSHWKICKAAERGEDCSVCRKNEQRIRA